MESKETLSEAEKEIGNVVAKEIKVQWFNLLICFYFKSLHPSSEVFK